MAKLCRRGLLLNELVIEVLRVNGLALAAGDRLTPPLGLTSARWQVMGVVDHGPTPVAPIARTMGLTRQSVRETADALAKLLTLGDAGRKAMRAIEADHAVGESARAQAKPRRLASSGWRAAARAKCWRPLMPNQHRRM